MIRCYRDEDDYRRAAPNGVHPLIASFLDSDVRSGPGECQELIRLIEAVKDGRRLEWSGTYNAHAVTIRPDGVVIENLWDDSLGVAHIPLELFRDCLEAWAAFLSS
jgi:hypothetical protein